MRWCRSERGGPLTASDGSTNYPAIIASGKRLSQGVFGGKRLMGNMLIGMARSDGPATSNTAGQLSTWRQRLPLGHHSAQASPFQNQHLSLRPSAGFRAGETRAPLWPPALCPMRHCRPSSCRTAERWPSECLERSCSPSIVPCSTSTAFHLAVCAGGGVVSEGREQGQVARVQQWTWGAGCPSLS